MAITAGELAERYPILFHMASAGSWASIRQHGLLSTSSLVTLFGVPERQRPSIIAAHRKDEVTITNPLLGTARLRDQKPLSRKCLERCLTDCTPEEWYQTLNERVFFWLSRERLATLMSAAEYVERTHTVLQIETAALVQRYGAEIDLAAMNTGSTRPFPHPRGRSTFLTMKEYPYQTRRRRSDYDAVVELTVPGGVPDIRDVVVRVEHAALRSGQYVVEELLYQRAERFGG